MPKISVIVPVYNVEKYLSRCIDSILAQTFTDFELILVDDGSLDNCGKICDEYVAKDNRIRVIHKKNEGVSVARNIGIDNAKGKYLMFVDSDDEIYPNMLSNMYEIINSENTDCVISGLEYFYDYKNDINRYPLPRQHFNICNEINNYFQIINKSYAFFPLVTKLYDMEIIKKYDIKCAENISILEDSGFVYNYLKYSKDISLDDHCYYRYRQTTSPSLIKKYNSNSLQAIEYFFATSEWIIPYLNDANKKVYYDLLFSHVFSFILQIYTRSNMCQKSKKEKLKEYFKSQTIRKILKNTYSRRFNFKKKVVYIMLKMKMKFALNLLLTIYSKKNA